MKLRVPTGILLALLVAAPGRAACPSPLRSSCTVSPSALACQYRFRADGSGGQLALLLTLRNAFALPVVACSTTVDIVLTGPNPAQGCWNAEAGAALGSCDGLSRSAITDSAGVAQFVFSRLTGRGSGEIVLQAHFCGSQEICRIPLQWTSSALTGGAVAGISDLGVWASCLGAGGPCLSADFNCDCLVGVADLGYWAGGLGMACGP